MSLPGWQPGLGQEGWLGLMASAWHGCCCPCGLIGGQVWVPVLSLSQLKSQMVTSGGQSSKDLMPELQPL